ncbi:MAG TPA: HYR domain-containing protein, partial [Gaiellaceae bacterium]
MRRALIGTAVLLALAALQLTSGSVGAARLDADTDPPTLTLPSNITAEATGSSGAVVTFAATATDLVDGSVSVACTPASGATFPLTTTTVSCSATDSSNNTATGSFTVTVSDSAAPTLHLPSNIRAEATGSSGAVVTFTATATDLVNGSVSVACTPASGATFPLTTTTVSCSAADAVGNRATGNFTVAV